MHDDGMATIILTAAITDLTLIGALVVTHAMLRRLINCRFLLLLLLLLLVGNVKYTTDYYSGPCKDAILSCFSSFTWLETRPGRVLVM